MTISIELFKWALGSLFALAGSLFGYHKYISKQIREVKTEVGKETHSLRSKHSDLVANLPIDYVRNDRFMQLSADINQKLHDIEARQIETIESIAELKGKQ